MNYSNFDQVLKDLQSLNQTIEDIRQKIVTVRNGMKISVNIL